jgi:hypothetical protein
MNAKTVFLENLVAHGLSTCGRHFAHHSSPGGWESTLTLTLPSGATYTSFGTARTKSQADVRACEVILDQLPVILAEHGAQTLADRGVDAQAGDALLKLAVYADPGERTAAERSLWLQRNESDAALALVFDRWLAAGDPDVLAFGEGLGEKRRATAVEALIWRRYAPRVLAPGASEALSDLLREIEQAGRSSHLPPLSDRER